MSRRRLDRRGSGPWWFIAIGFLLYFMYSLAIAAVTEDDCGRAAKHWEFFPPGWECEVRVGL